MKRRAVFLDRDGVINQMVYHPEFGTLDSPANPDEFELVPGAAEAIRRLNQLELLVVVVSNQPGIAKGKFTADLLQAVKVKMERAVEAEGGSLNGIYYCLHHPEALLPEYRVRCRCRKPEPGLLFQAADDLQIDLSRSYMVGDGITDMSAGRAAGTTAILVSSRKWYVMDELEKQGVWPDHIAGDLDEAGRVIERLERGGVGCGATVASTSFSGEPG
jgi:D-glycero-D-manno-heptose 1,7-bisphosphate phosphatase